MPLGKLPEVAEPISYSLSFEIDPSAEEFKGETQIKVRLRESTDHIWLHGRDLVVERLTVKDAKGKTHKTNYEQRDKTGVALVSFGKELAAQEITLDFVYKAKFNQQMEGLYKFKVGEDNYAVTQMEAISARRAFPSFDEPRFKTPFEVRLTVPKDQVAVANSLEIKTKKAKDKKWKTVEFSKTLPLPTYLIAVAVGPYDIVEAKPIPANEVRKAPLPLRGLAARGLGNRLNYALEHAGQMVEYYENYTQQAYPFDKLDLIAASLAWGGMENAGLIVFNPSFLLVDKETPIAYVRFIHSILAHEITHQWFGNLVTVPWWDDIWLNESFAEWAEIKPIVLSKPEFQADLAQLRDTSYAVKADSLLSARRIRQPIQNEGDIQNAFDGITYLKGAQVLTMFEAWLGEETFKNAMRTYLNERKLSSGNSNELIDTLAKVSGQGERLKLAMRSFLDQPGVPQVTVSIDCSAKQPILKLSQQRYLPFGSKEEGNSQWGIPICVRLGTNDSSQTQCLLLDKPQVSFDLKATQCPAWYLPNANAAGYYRFSMSTADFAKLGVEFNKLTPAEQMAYAEGVSSAFRRGDIDVPTVLNAMAVLAKSSIPEVLLALVDDFEWIRDHVATDTTRSALDAFVQKLYLPYMERLGYKRRTDEPTTDGVLRRRLVYWLAWVTREPSVRAALLTQGKRALGLNGEGKVDLSLAEADLLETILAVTVQEQGEPAMRALVTELKINHDPNQHNRILQALGAARDTQLHVEVGEQLINDSLQSEDVQTLYFSLFSSSKSRAMNWKWTKEHVDELLAQLPSRAQPNIITVAGNDRCSVQDAAEVEQFFTPHLEKLVGGKQILTQSLEQIRQCSALRQHQDSALLQKWAAAR